ncbi:MAG TPA: hypothetical protein VE379_00850 [Vicinamibacterales bacterium]|nr:hypothetical protein [Vicinamibacterales bacterium]
MTGIELTADSCVLVAMTRGEGSPRLEAVEVFEPSEWPPKALSRTRRKRYDPRAVVVAWSPDDAALEPLRRAGFSILDVLTPEEALSLLARTRRPDTAAASAWLAVSRRGGAIVIARGVETLFATRLSWKYTAATRPNDQLLQRYVIVSHLAPALQFGMARVKQKHGVAVESVITCGDLPDLRSLTMPLIDELDLEVETLDTLDGLNIAAAAEAKALEYAPALHLSSIAAAASPAQVPRSRWWGRSAAAFAVLLGGWWLLSAVRSAPAESPGTPVSTPAPTATSGSSSMAVPGAVPLIPAAAVDGRGDSLASRDPLPAVSSILYGNGRRLAILNGRIVGEGDAVGARRIVRIERDAVILRDSAGGVVRVPVRRLKQAS